MAERKRPRKPKKMRPAKRRSHEGDDSEPMDEFDVPDICLGGATK